MVGERRGGLASPCRAGEPLLQPCGAGWEGRGGTDVWKAPRRGRAARVRWPPRCSGGGASRARRWGRRAESLGVGWRRRLSPARPPRRPLRAPPFPAGGAPHPARARWRRLRPVSLFPPDLPATSLEAGPAGPGRGGGAPRAPAPRAFAVAPATTASPRAAGHGADPPAAAPGLCGVAGGSSPPRGRLPCPVASRPPALGRAAAAARRASAAPGLPRGRQAPPHALRASGLSPTRSPCASRGRLPGSPALSPPPYLCRVLCPLGATLPVGAPSLCPRWWGGRVPGTRARVEAPVVGGPALCVCEVDGEGSAPLIKIKKNISLSY